MSIGNGLLMQQTGKEGKTESFYLQTESNVKDSYWVNVIYSSSPPGVIGGAVLSKVMELNENGLDKLIFDGVELHRVNPSQLFWVSDGDMVYVIGPLPVEEFDESILEYLLSTYPHSNVDAEVEALKKELEAESNAPVFVDELALIENANLLYTSDDFENPENFLNLIFNSRGSQIACYSNSPSNSSDFILNILNQKKYPNAQAVAAELVEQCKSKKVVSVPPVPLPYDITDCRIDFGKKLSAEGIPFYEHDLLQECLIRAYSLEKFIDKGGEKEDFYVLISEREPIVVDQIAYRNKPKEICEEDAEGNQTECYPYNDSIESPVEFVNGEYIPGNLTERVDQRIVDTTGVKEVEIIPEENSLRITVNGESATTNDAVKIMDGQMFVDNKGVEVYPDEAVTSVEQTDTIQKVSVKSSTDNPYYSIEASRPGNLLFLIPIEIPVNITIDAVTAEKRENSPWWAFLAG